MLDSTRQQHDVVQKRPGRGTTSSQPASQWRTSMHKTLAGASAPRLCHHLCMLVKKERTMGWFTMSSHASWQSMPPARCHKIGAHELQMTACPCQRKCCLSCLVQSQQTCCITRTTCTAAKLQARSAMPAMAPCYARGACYGVDVYCAWHRHQPHTPAAHTPAPKEDTRLYAHAHIRTHAPHGSHSTPGCCVKQPARCRNSTRTHKNSKQQQRPST